MQLAGSQNGGPPTNLNNTNTLERSQTETNGPTGWGYVHNLQPPAPPG